VTDDQLWQSARRGDEAAWRILYERYLPTVWRFVVSRVGSDRAHAEDVVSDTFLALVRLLASQQRSVDSLVAWLLSVARRRIDDQHRRNGRHAAAVAHLCRCTTDIAVDDASRDRHETRTRVLALLEELPADERLVLEWKYLEGLSVLQIAERLGRSGKAIESLLFRARRTMRATVEQSGTTEQSNTTPRVVP
jgi:RNA polymerase sigma-70 factor (ECF subfamily)